MKKIKTQLIENYVPGLVRGYYLVRESDEQRFYISLLVDERLLQKVCERHLGSKTGYEYWIDYSSGIDVKGAPAWSNVDHTDQFI